MKDIYADRGPRQGRSSHLWPGPAASTPITLEQFGELLPDAFKQAAQRERSRGLYSVKPGSVLFDMTLWQTNAAGERCDAFDVVRSRQADLVLVMGTSLSGLTIDNLAHMAGPLGVPRVVFDLGRAPVDSLKRQGGWTDERDCHVQGPLDAMILGVVHELGWLPQLFDPTSGFLHHLCLGSLHTTLSFVREHVPTDAAAGHMAQLEAAIAAEMERERRFYGDE